MTNSTFKQFQKKLKKIKKSGKLKNNQSTKTQRTSTQKKQNSKKENKHQEGKFLSTYELLQLHYFHSLIFI